ncbi:MAG: hypothetical protein HUU01_23150 [Saprospiraceae bacterium]|nr:hypothetical protein [Saprospiraceae bacterium]
MENKKFSKLSLKKETITKLRDDQLKQFVGGLAAAAAPSHKNCSCIHDSCDSAPNVPSCIYLSCRCMDDM